VVEIYTDNDEFFNGSELKNNKELYFVHGHLIHDFRPGVRASVSAGYNYGGKSSIDGEEKDDRKQTVGWAISFGFPVTTSVGVKLAYIGTRTQESTGTDSDSFLLAINTFW